MKLFKEIEIGTEFTSPDLAEGTLVKISAKKYAIVGSGDTKGTICPINTQVNDTNHFDAETQLPVGVVETVDQAQNPSGGTPLPQSKFDPAAMLAELQRKSWRNYTVTEYRVENEYPIVSKLGDIATNENFLEHVHWDKKGNPIFEPGITITLPEGLEEANYTGFMEVAIPKSYDRRVLLLSAQGLKGLELLSALIADKSATITHPGGGVSRAAHLIAVRNNARKNNRKRRNDRKHNLHKG